MTNTQSPTTPKASTTPVKTDWPIKTDWIVSLNAVFSTLASAIGVATDLWSFTHQPTPQRLATCALNTTLTIQGIKDSADSIKNNLHKNRTAEDAHALNLIFARSMTRIAATTGAGFFNSVASIDPTATNDIIHKATNPDTALTISQFLLASSSTFISIEAHKIINKSKPTHQKTLA